MKILTLLATGFEDLEALGTVALLRRAGFSVDLCGTEGEAMVEGKYQIKVTTDVLLEDVDANRYDLLLIPGGMPGVDNLYNNPKVVELIQSFNQTEKDFAAICAGPSILGKMGLLKGQHFTVFPGFEEDGKDGIFENKPVVVSDRVITARAAGSVHEFAFAIIERYLGKEKLAEIKADICFE